MPPKLGLYLTSGWRLWVLGLLCGAAIGLGHAPVSFPWLVPLTIPLIGWLWGHTRDARHAFWLGWLVGVGHFGPTLFWITEPFFVEPEVYGWLAPPALILMVSGMALFWGAGFAVARRWHGLMPHAVLTLSVTWAMSEYLRGTILTGFPWNLIAYVWIDTPIAQTLAWIGPYGLTWATLLAGLLPLIVSRPDGLVRLSYAAVAFGLLAGLGWMRDAGPPAYSDDPAILRIVQPNAAQDLKWHPDWVPFFFRRAAMLSQHHADPEPDVVIWPETAMPFLYGDNTMALQSIADAAGPNTELIAGIQRREQGRFYNSLLYHDASGGIVELYDKHHLVPFGEYMPLSWVLDRFGIFGLAARDTGGYSAGPGPRVITGRNLPDFQPLICYEAIFPRDARLRGQRPGWILHITNDAWFGTYQGPYQHLTQTRARAIEQGLPVARAANTGISAMIGPRGRVLSHMPLGEHGALTARLPEPLPPTLFSWLGSWPTVLLWLFLGATAGIHRWRVSAETKD